MEHSKIHSSRRFLKKRMFQGKGIVWKPSSSFVIYGVWISCVLWSSDNDETADGNSPGTLNSSSTAYVRVQSNLNSPNVVRDYTVRENSHVLSQLITVKSICASVVFTVTEVIVYENIAGCGLLTNNFIWRFYWELLNVEARNVLEWREEQDICYLLTLDALRMKMDLLRLNNFYILLKLFHVCLVCIKDVKCRFY